MNRKKWITLISTLCLILVAGCGSSKEPSASEMEALQAELNDLMNHKPENLVTCTACNGSGQLDVCDKCKGSGSILLPSLNPSLALQGPCDACFGSGGTNCDQCMNGQMINPNLESERKAWKEKKYDILGKMGYSEKEIRQMETEEARAYLDGYSSGSDLSDYSGSSDFSAPDICRHCYGSGKCHTCGGDRRYQNMYTGSQTECPNCTDGTCSFCGGSGQAR